MKSLSGVLRFSMILVGVGALASPAATAQLCETDWEKTQLEAEEQTQAYLECDFDEIKKAYEAFMKAFHSSCEGIQDDLPVSGPDLAGFKDEVADLESALDDLTSVEDSAHAGAKTEIKAVRELGKSLHATLSIAEPAEPADTAAADTGPGTSTSEADDLKHDLCVASLEWKKAEVLRKRWEICPAAPVEDAG